MSKKLQLLSFLLAVAVSFRVGKGQDDNMVGSHRNGGQYSAEHEPAQSIYFSSFPMPGLQETAPNGPIPDEDGQVPQDLEMSAFGMADSFQEQNAGAKIGSNFFGLDSDFNQGLLIRGENIITKIGGYAKVDLIQDFNPIGSEDAFNIQTIEVGGTPRTNTRFHARQTRLNFDTRWDSDWGPVRLFVEGDFFFNQATTGGLGTDRFRLRHARIEYGKWTVGQTWTTFSDVAASPATLDFEGQVASIATRRTQVRWTQPIEGTFWSVALAIEDPFTSTEIPTNIGSPRTETPDSVVRLRLSRPQYQMQMAAVARQLGFQPIGQPISSEWATGTNFTQVLVLNDSTKLYSELLWGTGIASFLGSPDIVRTGPASAEVAQSLGWMVGLTHKWTPQLWSNLTYAENQFDSFPGLVGSSLKRTSYFAVNLIASPIDRFEYGIEYLYGQRQNIDGQSGIANRLQAALTVYLN